MEVGLGHLSQLFLFFNKLMVIERDEYVCRFLSFSDKSIYIPSMQIPYTFMSIELKEIIIILCEGDIDELG